MQGREKNVKYLSLSPHWFHVDGKLPTECLRVFVFFICIFFILLEGRVWIWVCWSVFSKCRYVISFHSNHWDHTELCYHFSLLFFSLSLIERKKTAPCLFLPPRVSVNQLHDSTRAASCTKLSTSEIWSVLHDTSVRTLRRPRFLGVKHKPGRCRILDFERIEYCATCTRGVVRMDL